MTPQDNEGKSEKPRRVTQPKRTPVEIKKGLLIMVKAPPYYTREYLYQVTSAGDKLVRADLYHSPRVRKHWTTEELTILFEMGMIRVAGEEDLKGAADAVAPEEGSE